MDEVITLPVGSSTVVELPFSAHPMPKVKWTFNKGSLPNGRRFKEDTIYGMTSVSMAKLVRKDSGNYVCTLENELGKAELTIKLIVLGK